MQPDELPDLDTMLERMADTLADTPLAVLPAVVQFEPTPLVTFELLLAGRTIAVARDAAFSFIYSANLSCLTGMGARLHFFSPLADECVPSSDALYLPGGYPELYAERLSSNRCWTESIRDYAAGGSPILAECGGLMALVDTLITQDGVAHSMAGLLPGTVRLRTRIAAIGLQALPLAHGELRGHTFHCSELRTPLAPMVQCVPHRYGTGEFCYRTGSITASYLHAYFPSNPTAAAGLFTGTT
jgi:cobyrinic acid a,c-diamide synthase